MAASNVPWAEQRIAAELLLKVKSVGTASIDKACIIENGRYVYSAGLKTAKVEFSWRDESAENSGTRCYYVRGEQQDGEGVGFAIVDYLSDAFSPADIKE